MAYTRILGGLASHLIGANVFIGTETLASGSVTIDISADVTDGRELEAAPTVLAFPQAAGAPNAGATTASTSTVTLDDGSGANSHDVFVVIIEPVSSGTPSA